MFKGGLNVKQLERLLHIFASMSESQSAIAPQLFESLLKLNRGLESINATYDRDYKKSKLIVPPALEDTMSELQKIYDFLTGKGDG